MVDISLYVPCYNGARTIVRCLESVLSSATLPADIMVIDDGSTDETAKLVARFPSVRLLRQPRNMGLGAARNQGLKEARYDWVASIDADVMVATDWVSRMLALKDAFPEACGLGGKLIETVTRTAGDRWRCAHMRQEWGDARIINPPFLFGSNTLVDRKKILVIGGYDERLRTNGEDVNLAYRLRQKTPPTLLIYDPDAVCFHMREDTVASILRGHWQWYRHPYAALFPPQTICECLSLTYRRLLKNTAQKIAEDIQTGRWEMAAVGSLCLLDNPLREWRSFYRRRNTRS